MMESNLIIVKHTAAFGCNQTKKQKRTILFVDARAIMHLYGIFVPLNRRLTLPVSIHTKG